MKIGARIPLLLLGLTIGKHSLVDVLAQFFDDPVRARRALFYIAGGIVSAALYLLVWHLVPKRPRDHIAGATGLTCAWAALEESEVAICRIAAGINKPVSVPMWHGLCDQVVGLPLSSVTLSIPVYIAYMLATKGDAK